MKTCKDCGHALNRGATGGTGGNDQTCLVCRVERDLTTFVYQPLYAPGRRGPRRQSRSGRGPKVPA